MALSKELRKEVTDFFSTAGIHGIQNITDSKQSIFTRYF
jgi:hypothetical protein